MDLRPWTVHKSTVVVDDNWLKVRADTCETSHGVTLDPYYVLEFPDWINIAAFDDQQRMLLIRQYRHGTREISLEIPSGRMDVTNETPEETARRELLEETGYASDDVHHVGTFTPNSARNRNMVHSFVAYNIFKKAEPSLDEAEQITAEWATIPELLQMIDSGIFTQGIHLTTIFMALRHAGILKQA